MMRRLAMPARYRTVRSYFLALLLLALVPVWLFAGALLVQLWSKQRDQVRASHESAVNSLAISIEGALADSIRRLEILSSSPLLGDGRIEEFRVRALDGFLALSPEWRSLALVDLDGAQIFGSAVRAGEPVPRDMTRPHRRVAVTTRRATVSDLYESRQTGGYEVEIAVPVIAAGELQHLLLAALDLRYLEQLTAQLVQPEDIVAMVDSGYRIIARTRDGASYIGKPPVPALLAQMRREPTGWGRFVTFEGNAVYTAWTKVPRFPWHIAFGRPAAPIDDALTRSLGLLAGAGLLVFLASAGLALLMARRLAAGIGAAAHSAQDVAGGRPVALPRTRIAELDRLGDALREAGRRLATEAAERARAEAERNALLGAEREARAYAEAQNRAKDEFLAMLGHELRNPLAAIANAARLAERAAPDAAAVRSAIEVINRQAAHQGRLLDDLLDVARVLTGKISLERAPVDLADCVGRALDALAAAGKTSRHPIERALGPAWVDGDAVRIEQIVANLVGNAIKFTPAGGRIRVATARVGGHAVIRVADEGAGIAPELMPRIFDLFAQGEQDAARGAGGLGVGLTLVRRLAELHGGNVTAETGGPDRGATFTVRLPEIGRPARGVTSPQRAASATTRRVLLVEDNDDARESLAAVLALDGHAVHGFASAAEALAAAPRIRPEVAILDIGLAGMDGYQLARALRAALGSELRLIALTGYGLAQDRRRALESGFDAHLVKPVDHSHLAAAVSGTAPPAVGDLAA
jgi:signal transduction histidine kinase/ActR/RegA family two-component response regulator